MWILIGVIGVFSASGAPGQSYALKSFFWRGMEDWRGAEVLQEWKDDRIKRMKIFRGEREMDFRW